MGLLHVVSAMASHWRASTAKPAHSEGWLLMLETQTKLSGVEGAWLGLKFPPRGPLPVTACAFLLLEVNPVLFRARADAAGGWMFLVSYRGAKRDAGVCLLSFQEEFCL